MPLIEVVNLTKRYTAGESLINAVDNVSLRVNKGEFISIMGHSGSGKTTLLSIVGGILKPTSGMVIFGDVDIYSLNGNRLSDYRAEKIGIIFQFASLLPVLTARENMLLSTLFTTDRTRISDAEKRVVELLDMVGLVSKVNAFPSQLSGGQQRRVAIARAFMNEPEVILADEPTGDLDEETEAEMMRFFRRMNEEKGITFIMVTHNSALARQAERTLKMSNGKISEL